MRQQTQLAASVMRLAGRNFVSRALTASVMGGALLLGLAISGQAADPQVIPGYVAGGAGLEHIVVTVNKSRTVNVGRPFTRAIVGATDFADVLPLNERSIYIQAKKVGSTNVSLLDAQGQLVKVIDLEIVLDTGGLQQKIRSSPGQRRHPGLISRSPNRAERSCGRWHIRRPCSASRQEPLGHQRGGQRDAGCALAAGDAGGPFPGSEPRGGTQAGGQLVRRQPGSGTVASTRASGTSPTRTTREQIPSLASLHRALRLNRTSTPA